MKKSIIKALKTQKLKLNNQSRINDYSIWHGSTLYYIESIFGKEAYAYIAFSQFRAFDIQDISNDNYSLIKLNLEKLFDECIDMVKSGFYKKPPKTNFLQNLDNSLLGIIITGVCTACFLLGLYTSDVKNYDLKRDNKNLLDSLNRYKTSVISQNDSIRIYKQKIQTILNMDKK